MMVPLIEEEIVRALSKNEGVALATVTYRTGSAPRGVGAKMLIRSDGSSAGSIGGGCVEAEVWQEAKRAIETGEAKTLRFELTPDKLAEGGLICGGTVEVFIEPLLPASPDLLGIYDNIVKLKKEGGSSLLATLLPLAGSHFQGIKAKMLIGLDGSSMGSLLDDPELVERVGAEVGPVLRENRTRILQIQREDRPFNILLEPIRPEPTVFIFGCGHISTCLAPLANTLGFHVVVTDDRPMFANRERFPEADEIVVAPFNEVFNRLKIDESAYLVIVTRGHIYDGAVLEQALQTGPRYIGMIGSRKKIGTLYANLMKKGISRDLLRRVHAPIGLDIGAETPEEIAISIVAELIQVRAEKR